MAATTSTKINLVANDPRACSAEVEVAFGECVELPPSHNKISAYTDATLTSCTITARGCRDATIASPVWVDLKADLETGSNDKSAVTVPADRWPTTYICPFPYFMLLSHNGDGSTVVVQTEKWYAKSFGA
jgi:hypothetical protein